MTKEPFPTFVYLDWNEIERHMLRKGLTIQPLSIKLEMSLRTIKRWRSGCRTQVTKAKELATFLEVPLASLLSRTDPSYLKMAPPTAPVTGPSEWEPQGYLDQQRLTSNGLCVVVCRLAHRHLSGRLARGKNYPLMGVAASQRQSLQEKLVRHSAVCDRLKHHPNIVHNISANFGLTNHDWWVIDEWIGEKSLADLLEEQELSPPELAGLLTGICNGLKQLHVADVIMRELSPQKILLRDGTLEPVLTDFELARLLDGSPSVSSDWPEDPFRAPDVDSGVFERNADFYSLAKVALACVGGNVRDDCDAQACLESSGMPKRVMAWFLNSLAPVAAERPQSIEPLLTELQRWKSKVTQ